MHTKSLKRMLHGQDGRGRFKAFALGATVNWKVVYKDDKGQPYQYDIAILEREISLVRVSGEEQIPNATTGVIVTVSELKQYFSSLKPENAVQNLIEVFGIYLKDYRDVSITYSGEMIESALAIQKEWKTDLSPITDEDDIQHPVSLEVIEWRRSTKRALYLCNAQGFPLSQVDSRFHVGDFHFSAFPIEWVRPLYICAHSLRWILVSMLFEIKGYRRVSTERTA